MKSELFIEFNNHQINSKLITKKAKEIWKSKGNKVKDLKRLDLYFQPETKRCYYIFNEKDEGNNYFEI